jgi:hypothetical protein
MSSLQQMILAAYGMNTIDTALRFLQVLVVEAFVLALSNL